VGAWRRVGAGFLPALSFKSVMSGLAVRLS
jgi:hypothetical protein